MPDSYVEVFTRLMEVIATVRADYGEPRFKLGPSDVILAASLEQVNLAQNEAALEVVRRACWDASGKLRPEEQLPTVLMLDMALEQSQVKVERMTLAQLKQFLQKVKVN